MEKQAMIDEIKNLIITKLNLEDISIDDIDPKIPLFGDDGLGLDSVDALELSLAISKQYGIVLDAKTDRLKEIFLCVENLANFVLETKK